MNDIFFLNDAQYAFLIGRQSDAPLCKVSCHIIIGYEAVSTDEDKLRKAWSALAERHIVLRSRINPDGSVYLSDKHEPQEYFYTYNAVSEQDSESYISRLNNKLMDIENGECFALHLIRSAEKTKIIFEADCAAFDITSMQIFIHDLAALYTGDTSILSEIPKDFHPYGITARPEIPRSLKRADKAYWEEKISGFGLPPFEGMASIDDIKAPTAYKNHLGTLETDIVCKLEKLSGSLDVPMKDILLTLFCSASAKITEKDNFLLNIPLLDRSTESLELRKTAADYTSIIMFDAKESASDDLMQLCKKYSCEMAEAINHRHFSGIKVQQMYSEKTGRNVISGNVTFSSHIHIDICSKVIKKAFGNISLIYTETPNVIMDSEFFRCGDEIIINLSTPDGCLPKCTEEKMLSEIISAAEELINAAEQEGRI